jgi:hypothetical protein
MDNGGQKISKKGLTKEERTGIIAKRPEGEERMFLPKQLGKAKARTKNEAPREAQHLEN